MENIEKAFTDIADAIREKGGTSETLYPSEMPGGIRALPSGGGDTKTFVAEYGVTTAQEIIAYLDASKEPFAPMLIKRGNDYYTVTTAAKQADNKIIIRSFATLSGDFYMFTYTVTDGAWASSSHGFQKKLESGVSIKTINGESLLGSGDIVIQGGGSITVDDTLSDTSTNPIQNRVLHGVFESQRQVVEYMQQRIEALENKLNKYSDIPLTLTDGTNTVDRVVLGKLPSKFDIPAGGYDAEGNLVMTGEQVAALMTTGTVGSQQTPYWSILDAASLDSRVNGIVLPKKKGDITPTSIGGSGGSIATFINYATDNQFDYVVLPDTVTSIWCDRFANLPTAVKTLYYRGSNTIGNPWGMTNMIIDTEG